jgi:hypothetical protein
MRARAASIRTATSRAARVRADARVVRVLLEAVRVLQAVVPPVPAEIVRPAIAARAARVRLVPVLVVRAVVDVPAAVAIPAADRAIHDKNKRRFGAFCFCGFSQAIH